ncbi:hypothetical protein F511_15042 [Dorcoceras hygrometricum]|uniref:Ribonuclease H1 N-terminal domain-containing protein n=1 Tax=Dorcoceras hygrometricum TaxID=472368 RepID=A0A2Z7BR67_9LAMI|nr:hypothetical protein F511_15042 [Dorcoceras hygrometricum]
MFVTVPIQELLDSSSIRSLICINFQNEAHVTVDIMTVCCRSMLPKSYVFFIGRQPDVYDKWSEASKQVCGFRGACYKWYDTNKEAEEAFSCYLEAMDAARVHKKCESEKTSTTSTSRPQRAKNSLKLVKVLRDLAVEIHNHAAGMEKVVQEIGQILEDMAVSDDE